MSIAWMSRVWDDPQLEGSELLLMLALADHANDEGVCWPSIPRLAQRARISERQTQRLIRKLAQEGYLKVIERGQGRSYTNYYVLLEKGDILSPKPAIIPRKGDTQMSPFSSSKKGDTTMSPITPEKGDMIASPIPEKRVTSSAKRVTFDANKGDIAMSPDPIEPSLREPSEKHAAAAPPPRPIVPDVKNHPNNQHYHAFHGRWPDRGQMQLIAEHNSPPEQFATALRAWAGKGYKRTNVEGILEWADDPSRIPTYTKPTRAEMRKFNGNAEHRPSLGKHGYDPGDQATIERAIRDLQTKNAQRPPHLQVPDL